MNWRVYFSKKAQKQLNLLPENIANASRALVNELELLGPMRHTWKNFGKLRGTTDCYHCHIKQGNPTYVVCWKLVNKKIQIIEVYYVGTHENARY